jgi:hypothetical protein
MCLGWMVRGEAIPGPRYGVGNGVQKQRGEHTGLLGLCDIIDACDVLRVVDCWLDNGPGPEKETRQTQAYEAYSR